MDIKLTKEYTKKRKKNIVRMCKIIMKRMAANLIKVFFNHFNGMVMGLIFAPTSPAISMRYFEVKLVKNVI